jgi:hypothetical protein
MRIQFTDGWWTFYLLILKDGRCFAFRLKDGQKWSERSRQLQGIAHSGEWLYVKRLQQPRWLAYLALKEWIVDHAMHLIGDGPPVEKAWWPTAHDFERRYSCWKPRS